MKINLQTCEQCKCKNLFRKTDRKQRHGAAHNVWCRIERPTVVFHTFIGSYRNGIFSAEKQKDGVPAECSFMLEQAIAE